MQLQFYSGCALLLPVQMPALNTTSLPGVPQECATQRPALEYLFSSVRGNLEEHNWIGRNQLVFPRRRFCLLNSLDASQGFAAW